MKLSGGDVLSFLDLAKYLAQYGYEYNLDNNDDRNNLRTVILNLCSDYMLRTTFYYSGIATISKHRYKNGDDFKIISTVKKNIAGDFILDTDSLWKLLQNNEPIYLDGQSFDIFTAVGLDDEPILHNHREEARKANSHFFSVRIGGEIDSPLIKMGDLHYVRADIDKAIKIGFFDHITGREQAHEKTQQLIIEAQAKITDLENQLKQVKAELANKPTNEQLNDHMEKSYQTTIGLLLELMTTPKGIDNKAPFQSQATIIGDILDKDIQGQRKTTLENRFRDANLMLADAKKKRPKSN